MSAPSSAHTCTAYRLGGWPRTACTPAECTSMSLRLPIRRRKNPSAIGLRQILPVQTKRTLFTVRDGASEYQFNLKANRPKSIQSKGMTASQPSFFGYLAARYLQSELMPKIKD